MKQDNQLKILLFALMIYVITSTIIVINMLVHYFIPFIILGIILILIYFIIEDE